MSLAPIAPAFEAPSLALPTQGLENSAAESLRLKMLFFVGLAGGTVIIEPSPYELAALITMGLFAVMGEIRLHRLHLPLFAIMSVYGLGLSMSALMVLDKEKVAIWTIVSWYMLATGLFYAAIMTRNTAGRFDALMRGWLWAALFCAMLGILGYLHLIPGGDIFTRYDRLKGTFNDPNVTGPFFIAPILLLIQRYLFGRLPGMVRASLPLGILMIALLFTFSRGAWFHMIVSLAVMLALLFVTARSDATRTRIVAMCLIGAVAMVALLALILSIDSIGEQFTERANLNQTYDNGPMGRFGRHIYGLQLALASPLGIGPLQFSSLFGEDTHNAYLNNFMAGGWTGGIAYFAMVLVTLLIGFATCFVRVPWQTGYIAIYAAYLGVVAESAIIDSEHWRHYWLQLGLIWGLTLAARMSRPSPAALR